MSYSDIEHCSNMISGCESLIAGNRTPDSVYAFAVLKLHAQDAGYIDGQEGFLDNVKSGAKKSKEWILKLLKAIRDFFFGGNRAKIKKLAADTEVAAKIIEKDNIKDIVPNSVSEIVKINKAVTGDSKWGDAVMKDYNALPAEEKKEVEEKIEKVVSDQDLNELGKDAVEALKTKLTAKLETLKRLGNTINNFGKDATSAFKGNGGDITIDLNGMTRDAEKELVLGIESAIKELKISNLSSTIKWFMTIAETYTKDLDTITTKAKQLAEKTDDTVALGRIHILSTAYAELIKCYQDLVIISNYVLTKTIAKTQDKVIKAILSKVAATSRPASDKYVGISPEDSIVQFYSK